MERHSLTEEDKEEEKDGRTFTFLDDAFVAFHTPVKYNQDEEKKEDEESEDKKIYLSDNANYLCAPI